jgi:hypothetical protein
MRVCCFVVVLALAACGSKPPSPPRKIESTTDPCVREPPQESTLLIPPPPGPRASLALLIAPRAPGANPQPRRAHDEKLARVAIDFSWLALPDDVVAPTGELAGPWAEHRDAMKALSDAQRARIYAEARGPQCAEAVRRESERAAAVKARVASSRARLLHLVTLSPTKEPTFDDSLARAAVEEEEATAIEEADPAASESARAIARSAYAQAAAAAAPERKRFWANYGAARLAASAEEQARSLRAILAGETPTTLASLEARYRLAEVAREAERCSEASDGYRVVVERAARDQSPFAPMFRVVATLRWAEADLCLGKPKSAIAIAAGVFDLVGDADLRQDATAAITFAIARLDRGEGEGLPAVPLPVFAAAARAVATAAEEQGDRAAAAYALAALRTNAPALAVP